MRKLIQLQARWFLLLAAVTGCDSADKAAPEKNEEKKPAASATNDGESGQDREKAEKVEAALAKLSPEDQKQAKAQGVCPVSKEPLGSMGVPIKVTVGDKSVFICCAGCEKDARDNIEKYAGGGS
jgi:hypothetical protein